MQRLRCAFGFPQLYAFILNEKYSVFNNTNSCSNKNISPYKWCIIEFKHVSRRMRNTYCKLCRQLHKDLYRMAHRQFFCRLKRKKKEKREDLKMAGIKQSSYS